MLRVAVYDTQWHLTQPVVVESANGQTVVRFTNPAKTGVISVRRQAAGEVMVGWRFPESRRRAWLVSQTSLYF
jgi:hypothetical protein